MLKFWKHISPMTRCRIITSAILLVGLVNSLVIYLTATDAPLDPFAEFEKSKKFAYELERMGGKAAILANDFNTWFAGLWQGESLAYTVAVVTVVVAAGYYFVASSLIEDARIIQGENPPTPFSH
jgi:predicted NBD/HSP70 family sugar kinase